MRTLIIATIKKTSQQVGKIISYTILVLFFCWLIAGIGYQLLGQKDIQERKAGMLNVLNGIDILDQLTLENIHLVQPAKALISYKLTAYFTTEKNKSTFIKQIRDYLLNNGWEIVLYENTPQSFFLEAKKDTYICTIETSSQESIHVWNVTIMCDDFFSRYNL